MLTPTVVWQFHPISLTLCLHTLALSSSGSENWVLGKELNISYHHEETSYLPQIHTVVTYAKLLNRKLYTRSDLKSLTLVWQLQIPCKKSLEP